MAINSDLYALICDGFSNIELLGKDFEIGEKKMYNHISRNGLLNA